MTPLPAVLGINLWLVTLVVPLLLALGGLGGSLPSPWMLAILPLGPLALSLGLRRPRHPAAAATLLCGVPLLCLVPAAESSLGHGTIHPPAAAALQIGVLLAYLGVVCRALESTSPGASPAPLPESITIKPLGKKEVPLRWRRRMSIYRGLFLFSILLPGMLLYAIDFHPPTLRALRLSFGTPARLGAVQAAVTATVALLWVVVFHACFLRPLSSHLEHDKETMAQLDALRRGARRGRPRFQFYLAMLLALGSMILLIWRSLRT